MKTHPYIEFEGSVLWKTVSKSVAELEKNGDLRLTTNSNYVVGFLCKQLVEEKLLLPVTFEASNSQKSPQNKSATDPESKGEWYRIAKVVGRSRSKQ